MYTMFAGSKPSLSSISLIAKQIIWYQRRSEEHTSELQSQSNIVCRLLLEKKKTSENVLHLLTASPRLKKHVKTKGQPAYPQLTPAGTLYLPRYDAATNAEVKSIHIATRRT